MTLWIALSLSPAPSAAKGAGRLGEEGTDLAPWFFVGSGTRDERYGEAKDGYAEAFADADRRTKITA